MTDSYKVKVESVEINGVVYRLQTLLDQNQFSDDRGLAEKKGINPNEWAYFGMLWPSAHILADTISRYPIEGLRILEVGCGIGLASIIAQKRKANIVASDYHPMAASFLTENARLNELPPLAYLEVDWSDDSKFIGEFDLVIGSDIVYDRRHPSQLSKFINRHLSQAGEVLLVIPGREHCSKFIKEMTELEFLKTEERFFYPNKESTTCRGRVLKFRRSFIEKANHEFST